MTGAMARTQTKVKVGAMIGIKTGTMIGAKTRVMIGAKPRASIRNMSLARLNRQSHVKVIPAWEDKLFPHECTKNLSVEDFTFLQNLLLSFLPAILFT